jgi:alpha-tubulin suppressor-like RCC1 family protein
MGEISGVPAADINNVDGFFTTQGGGSSITANPVANSGELQISGQLVIWSNPDVGAEFNRGQLFANHGFVKIQASYNHPQFFAIKNDGTLWYWAQSNTNLSGQFFTVDSQWHQYGVDTDWTDITGGQVAFGAVKGGVLYFIGSGTYRQAGNGTTSNYGNWTVVENTKTWVRYQMGYRMSIAITNTGEAWSTGYGYDYQTGLNTTSTIAVWTREKTLASDWVDAAYGYRCGYWHKSNGEVWFSGNNTSGVAGPQVSGTTAQNGPVLAHANTTYVIQKIFNAFYGSSIHLDSNGYLRFSGAGNNRTRPDNSTASATNGGIELTAAGNLWTHYEVGDPSGQTSSPMGIAVKSDGTCWIGGGGTVTFQAVYGLTPTNNWSKIADNVTIATSSRSGRIAHG